MGAFGLMGGEYEQVVYNHDPASGLKAIIAIHSTALGPALGGERDERLPAHPADGAREPVAVHHDGDRRPRGFCGRQLGEIA